MLCNAQERELEIQKQQLQAAAEQERQAVDLELESAFDFIEHQTEQAAAALVCTLHTAGPSGRESGAELPLIQCVQSG